jgi:hypothetical protein
VSVSARQEDLGAELERAWHRSDELFGFVSDAAMLTRPIRLRQPFQFYLGHLPAFAWNHLGRRALSRPAFAPDLDTLFEAGIDPPDDEDPAQRDEATAWPVLERVLAYRDRVRDELRGELGQAVQPDVLAMVVEHELMHHETLLYMLQELPVEAKRPPSALAHAPVARTLPAVERIHVPEGTVVLGTQGGGFHWDNERPEHRMHTPALGSTLCR